MAGAFLESRELLVIGGQVKTSNLARSQVRQRGIQEIDGVALAAPITERSIRIESAVDRASFAALTRSGVHGRKGPVFLEVPLDVQGTQVDAARLNSEVAQFQPIFQPVEKDSIQQVVQRIQTAQRPVLLLGGGIERVVAGELQEQLRLAGVPVMLTWNATDRVGADHEAYFGRPNTWGMRYANILLQQADLLVALGTRLSLQQSGFNWQQFLPVGEIVQVDCDAAELHKGHPSISLGICADANEILRALVAQPLGDHREWVRFCRIVRDALPLVEECNLTREGYLNPYMFAAHLSGLCTPDDVVIPCSSGSAFTIMMQTFLQKQGQRIVTNKGLASMGYGLSGAIGAAFAGSGRRTILIEGDGGFTQNLQELGTVRQNRLNLKIFLFDDNGYASIRMTQKNYFGGKYIGCDLQTGLGLPDWEKLFGAYSIPVQRIGPRFDEDKDFLEAFESDTPAAFLVHIDPEQTYFPKISSRVTETGSMESNPLHRMTPELDEATTASVFRYLPQR
jgi:acetolactate synthase-1/2/3 large subunit